MERQEKKKSYGATDSMTRLRSARTIASIRSRAASLSASNLSTNIGCVFDARTEPPPIG